MADSTYWNGKHALITGSSAGLGLKIAQACAAQQMNVTLVARDSTRLEEVAKHLQQTEPQISVHTIPGDLSQAGEATRVFEQASSVMPLDVVCHAAGLSARGRVTETSREDHERLIAVNFLAAAELASASAQPLAECRGHFVLIGSLAAHVGPAFLGAYPPSKHAVAALAQQLRMEWSEAGLHTLLVSPGPLTREDSGARYDAQAEGLPESARKPGGGARLNTIDPEWLAEQILDACQRRKPEMVVPRKARLLFAIGKLLPSWGDWLLKRKMR